MADRGYDGRPFQEQVERKGIVPIIDLCNHWKGDPRTVILSTRIMAKCLERQRGSRAL